MILSCLPHQPKESVDLLLGADPTVIQDEFARANQVLVRTGDARWVA